MNASQPVDRMKGTNPVPKIGGSYLAFGGGGELGAAFMPIFSIFVAVVVVVKRGGNKVPLTLFFPSIYTL